MALSVEPVDAAPSGRVVTASTANETHEAGVAYFRKLKEYGRGYLASAGFTFMPFPMDNGAVPSTEEGKRLAKSRVDSIQGLLNHALHSHTGSTSTVDKVLAFASA